ncbi:MAG: hypothetical protein KC656_29335, partial [Myxococcales bacterium]|nr:hypothetical protein [Myxococcales bacterium]
VDDALEPNAAGSPVAVTPGTFVDLNVSDVDLDLLAFTVPPDTALEVLAVPDVLTADLDARLLSDAGVVDLGVLGEARVRHWNRQSTDVSLYAEITADRCTGYTLEATLTPAPDCATPDAWEPNDTAGTAALLTTSTTARASQGQPDHYAIEVPADHRLTVVLAPEPGFGDVDAYQMLGGSTTQTDGFAPWVLSEANTTGTAFTRTVRVKATACMAYALDLELLSCTQDDAFEPNDTVVDAVALTSADDLFVSPGSPDHFLLGTVQPGETLVATFGFRHVLGDLDVTLVTADGPLSGVVGGHSFTDDERVEWTNAGPVAEDVVAVVEDIAFGGCQVLPYTLDVSVGP